MAEVAAETPVAETVKDLEPAAQADAGAAAALKLLSQTQEADGGSMEQLALASMGCAKDGDYVVLWATYSQVTGVTLQHGQITNNRYGSFHHDDLIGQPYGSKVMPRKGDAWMAMLRPTPELITQSLVHRTQIIYHADISLVMSLLDVRPGMVVVESGTGSGSVSASFARALRPGGRLHTFEFHAERQQQAAEDFRRLKLDDVVVSYHGDACANGFGEALNNSVHGVFLDLPMPWLAVPHVDRCLMEGGRIVSFSPCVEQVDKTAAELRRRKYHDIRMWETLAVNWAVKSVASSSKRRRCGGVGAEARAASPSPADDADAAGGASGAAAEGAGNWVSYQLPMRGHTGYLLSALKPPDDEL